MLTKCDQDILNWHRPQLVREIYPDSLFPELRKHELVTMQQEAEIKGEQLRETQVEKILDLLLRSQEDAFNKFCDALNACEQERIVSNYLKCAIKKETGMKHQATDDSSLIGTPPVKQIKKCSSSSTLSRQFQPKWQEEFSWVWYSETTNTMHCGLCRQQGKNNIWATDGTNNFRRKTLVDHERSADHRRSVETGQQPSKEEICLFSGETRQEDIDSALRVCLSVMTDDLHSVKFQSFLDHLQDSDNAALPIGLSYKIHDLIRCLSDVIEDDVTSEIRRSPHVGIRLDEWDDGTGGKYLIINARYVSSTAQIKTAFLRCVGGYDGQTVGIRQAVEDVASDYQIPLTKIVGLGTDCASVMANKLPDVIELLKEDSPHMVYLHCVCHRLDLAMSQTCNDVPSMATLQSIIAASYTFASMDRHRLENVHNMMTVLLRERVGMQCLYNVKWLKFDTVVALIRDYGPLMSLVQRAADSGDPTALGLKIQFCKYIYVALLHFMADVLSTTYHLSAQLADVDYSTVSKTVAECDKALSSLRDKQGDNMSMFESSLQVETGSYRGVRIQMQGLDGDGDFKLSFDGVRRQVLDKLEGHLASRSHQCNMLGAMQIFQPSAYRSGSQLLEYWGSKHLTTLLDHYGSRLENPGGKLFDALVDRDSCNGEFLPFKRIAEPFLDGALHYLQPVELMEKIFSVQKGPHNNRNIYKGMYRLMTACLCAMAGDAQVDRVLSCLHQIQPWLDTHIPTEQLNQLITIGSSSMTIDTFPFRNAIERFMQCCATNE